MSRRPIISFIGILALGLIALFPLRIAVDRLDNQGFTARQVAGTIWYGRIGELMFRGRRLGTFEAELDPLAMLTGAMKLNFQRLDDPQGVLQGALVSGVNRGLRDTTGRIGAAGLFGGLPVEAFELDDLTLLFSRRRCTRAAGQAKILLSMPLPGVDGVTLSGSPRCENDRVRFVLSTPTGAGKLDFYIRSSGDYRAWFHVRGANAEQLANLTAAGFTASPEGMMLSVDGKL